MKTVDLIGPPLDKAIAKSLGLPPAPYSTDWSLSGQLLEEEGISLHRNPKDAWPDEQRWTAAGYDMAGIHFFAMGPTPLVSVFRLILLTTVGEEIHP